MTKNLSVLIQSVPTVLQEITLVNKIPYDCNNIYIMIDLEYHMHFSCCIGVLFIYFFQAFTNFYVTFSKKNIIVDNSAMI